MCWRPSPATLLGGAERCGSESVRARRAREGPPLNPLGKSRTETARRGNRRSVKGGMPIATGCLERFQSQQATAGELHRGGRLLRIFPTLPAAKSACRRLRLFRDGRQGPANPGMDDIMIARSPARQIWRTSGGAIDQAIGSSTGNFRFGSHGARGGPEFR